MLKPSHKHNRISYLRSVSSLPACNTTEQCQKQTDQIYVTVSDCSVCALWRIKDIDVMYNVLLTILEV